MSENWHQLYTKITGLIANHSEIRIEPSIVRIGESVRPEFYQLFESAREAFLKETNKALIDEAEVLSEHYLQVEEEVIRLLGIEGIALFPRLDKFLHNPMEELIKELRDPLFNLLKGKIDITRYEQEASSALVSSFDRLYQQGYEIWMILSLIKLLEADKSFRVDVDEFDDDESFIHGGQIDFPVIKPEQRSTLLFKYNMIVGILVSDQIVHSAKLGYYFSFRQNIVVPKGEAVSKSKQKEWLPLPVETMTNLGSNVIFLYTDKELDELSLIADSKIVCRPDLIIECVGLEKLFNENSLARIEKYNEGFKPKLGTYIISNKPLVEEIPENKGADITSNEPVVEEKPEEKGTDIISNEAVEEKIPEEKEKDINFLSVGFDQSKLEQIINLFIKEENSDS